MKKLILVLGIIVIIAGLGVASMEVLRPYRGYTGTLIVDISPGMPARKVASRLVAKGVLAQRWPFLLLYGLGRWREQLKAGVYLFDRSMRPLDVYRKLAHGQVYIRSVVIPEGSNCFDIAKILHARLGVSRAAFLKVTHDTSLVHNLDPKAPSLEGYLFPDTYQFEYHPAAIRVAKTMVDQFQEVINRQLRQAIRQRGMTLHEVITLASLIEKETPEASERPIIAQVFELRLKRGMLLQCDPTVIYAAELNHLPADPITESDLKLQSPYNTYVHGGLPPGPICNPGEASIRAVLHPASTHYLYFVSNMRGGHWFATTLAEQERNVARYRKQEAALKRHAQQIAGTPERTHTK